MRKTHPAAERYNEVLRKLLRQVQQLLGDSPAWSAQQLRAALAKEADKQDFLTYLRKDIKRRALAGHPRTVEKFESIHNKLQSFRLGVPHRQARYPLLRSPCGWCATTSSTS